MAIHKNPLRSVLSAESVVILKLQDVAQNSKKKRGDPATKLGATPSGLSRIGAMRLRASCLAPPWREEGNGRACAVAARAASRAAMQRKSGWGMRQRAAAADGEGARAVQKQSLGFFGSCSPARGG